MKLILISILITCCYVSNVSGTPLDDQLKSLHKIQLAEKQRIANAKEATRKAQALKHKRIAVANEAKAKRIAAAQRERSNQQLLVAEEKRQEKLRHQKFEDQERELILEAKQSELALKKAMDKTKAENAQRFIDSELNKEAAKIDNIQVIADVKRTDAKSRNDIVNLIGTSKIAEATKSMQITIDEHKSPLVN
ncbi:DUF5384 family protein [uncultured Photobacterium sp.]|uniref:DUF5384 family protein n=1 Tax=uncultured Photobacterium sp. TaxID=173973 RepID=UPI002606C78E|nr:DUF5384 family protein [uncultured Photobacterium sp.]